MFSGLICMSDQHLRALLDAQSCQPGCRAHAVSRLPFSPKGRYIQGNDCPRGKKSCKPFGKQISTVLRAHRMVVILRDTLLKYIVGSLLSAAAHSSRRSLQIKLTHTCCD